MKLYSVNSIGQAESLAYKQPVVFPTITLLTRDYRKPKKE